MNLWKQVNKNLVNFNHYINKIKNWKKQKQKLNEKNEQLTKELNEALEKNETYRQVVNELMQLKKHI